MFRQDKIDKDTTQRILKSFINARTLYEDPHTNEVIRQTDKLTHLISFFHSPASSAFCLGAYSVLSACTLPFSARLNN